MRSVISACLLLVLLSRASAQDLSPSASRANVFHYDEADWHLTGEGVVGCPCRVPCPCRHNGQPSYGHCEATLYLHVQDGRYGPLRFKDLRVVETGGSCAMGNQKLTALYFDRSVGAEHQSAFMKLVASFWPDGTAEFPYVRSVSVNARVIDGQVFNVSIPGILEMRVDRSWGQASPPFPEVAACDHFSNTIQYAQNIRYRMHDDQAALNFDYSRRQANYRRVDLDVRQYRAKAMLSQFQDGSGWFNEPQLKLINEWHLVVPDLNAIRLKVSRLIRPPSFSRPADGER